MSLTLFPFLTSFTAYVLNNQLIIDNIATKKKNSLALAICCRRVLKYCLNCHLICHISSILFKCLKLTKAMVIFFI